MKYDFEINTTDTGMIEGELVLNGSNDPPKVKITSPLDVTMSDFSGLCSFFDRILSFHKTSGGINKIEIIKK